MTNLQEAKLAREAEICYATLALVTDYDCWHPDHDHVTVEMIVQNLLRNAETAQKVVKALVERLPAARTCGCRHGARVRHHHPSGRRTAGDETKAGAHRRKVSGTDRCSRS